MPYYGEIGLVTVTVRPSGNLRVFSIV